MANDDTAGLAAFITTNTTNTTTDSAPLTAETFRRGWERFKEMSDKADREYGERVREVAARGRSKSRLGRLVDLAYINGGPLIMSPVTRDRFEAELAAEEARAEAGEEQHLSEDDAIRVALAAWSSPWV